MICPTCRATVWFDTDRIGRSLEICLCGPKRMLPPQREPVTLSLRIIYGTRVCPGCGVTFSLEGKRQDTQYHSDLCRVAHWKRQQRAETGARSRLTILVRCSA